MTHRMTLASMTGLTLVIACSGASSNDGAAGDTTARGAPRTSGASSDGATVDVAFLTGRWTQSGDCEDAREFRADGTFAPPEGSTYTLSDNVLTVNVNEVGSSPGPFTITRTGDDAMSLTADGSSVELTRCH